MTGIIKVDTIQNNGGTTGLTLNSSGYMTTPNRPAFWVGMETSTTAANDGVIIFDYVIAPV